MDINNINSLEQLLGQENEIIAQIPNLLTSLNLSEINPAEGSSLEKTSLGKKFLKQQTKNSVYVRRDPHKIKVFMVLPGLGLYSKTHPVYQPQSI